MYELSCPSCHVVVNSPFVRVGAAVTCASCGHRYLIGQAHVKRVPTAGPAAVPDPLAASAKAPAPSQGGPGDSSAGLSGLSEMMRVEAQRERDNQFDDYDTIKPQVDEPRKPIDTAPPTAAPRAKKTKAQKAGRGGYLLAAAAAIALAILGGGLWAINWNPGSGGPQSDMPPKPVYEGPIFQGLPLAGSVALEHNPWVQPNSPYESEAQDDPSVFMADDGLAPTDTGVIEYVGKVVSERDGVVMAGELSVSLVNRQGMEKARAMVPIALVSKGQSMRVRLPIPASLDPTSLTPAWSITINDTLDSAVSIKGVSMKAQSVGADTMAKILLVNDTDEQLDRAELLVTAWDAQGLPLRRWRVSWTMPVAPSDDIEFYARTTVTPSWQIDAWTVLAVGEFSPVQPALASPDAQAD